MEFEEKDGIGLGSYFQWNKFLEGPEEKFGLWVFGIVGNLFKLEEE